MDPNGISYSVSHRDVKFPRLEFKTGNLLLILPFGTEPDSLLDKHGKWISKKIEFIKACLKEAPNKKLVERTREEFKDLIYSSVKKISRELGEKLNKIYFRTMKTKWASCSSNKNLTVNMLMSHLPEHLIKYIISHEISHLKEKRHTEEFWRRIARRFSTYQKLEKDLFVYWFQVSKALPSLNSAR